MSTTDLPDESGKLEQFAREVVGRIAQAGLRVSTAESCTGGLLASLITDLEGVSSVFDRGFVTYTEDSKCDLLGLSHSLIANHGIVSREVALAMAAGALTASRADMAVGITGFAGGAGERDEPGLVHIAARGKANLVISRECHFGAAPRDRVRMRSAHAALEMLDELLELRRGLVTPPQ
ncbi:MAG: CinA family protein [Pseudomonadota bacterium]